MGNSHGNNSATTARLTGASAQLSQYSARAGSDREAPRQAPPITGTTSIGAEAHQRLSALIGRDVTPAEARAMVGAPPDAHVSVLSVEHRPGAVEWLVDGPHRYAYQGETGSAAYSMHRVLTRESNGELQMLNERFIMHPEAQRSGLGTAIFAHEVETLSQIGVNSIGTFAARSGNAVDGYSQNGFYTWPLLGYNAKLGGAETSLIRRTPSAGSALARDHIGAVRAYESYVGAHTPQALATTPLSFGEKARLLTLAARGRLTIADLLSTPTGRAWWQYHGRSLGMTFDLRPGSASHQRLQAYLAARQAAGRPLPSV